MTRIVFIVFALSWALTAQAAWYWPFGGKGGEREQKRISELIEPASLLIDDAIAKAEDGKIDEAVETYRQALQELESVELANPDRVDQPEFATIRNKRAYVNTAIDALLFKQVQQNANAVAVTDTTELESKYAKLQAEKRAKKQNPGAKVDRKSLVMAAQKDLAAKRFDAAEAAVTELLKQNPKDLAALNLRAALESMRGDGAAAVKTLQSAIQIAPDNYYAYYNLAKLLIRTRGAAGRAEAAALYESGLDVGGPIDAQLEELLK